MSLGATAKAASLYFEAVATTATTICVAPCFQIRTFLEDETRALSIQAIQFDVAVDGDGTVANLPVPPATNGNAQAGNTNIEDADGNIAVTPFELSATVGASPTAGFDALFVLASATPFTVNSTAQRRADGVGCTPSGLCTIQLDGLTANRIYLGRFNMSGVVAGNTTSFTIGGLTGLAAEGVPLPAEIMALNGGSCDFVAGTPMSCRITGGVQPVGEPVSEPTGEPVAPEPLGLTMIGLALAGLGFARLRK
jgi:hypothetical protein